MSASAHGGWREILVSTRFNHLIIALFPVLAAVAIGAIFFNVIELDDSSDIIVVVDDPALLERIGPHLANVYASYSGLGAYLTTIQLGTFVLVGFSLSTAFQGKYTPSSIALTLHIVFVMVSFLSLHYGYIANMLLAERISAAHLDYGSVETMLGRQSATTALAAVLGLIAASLNLFLNRLRSEADPASDKSAETPPEDVVREAKPPRPGKPAAAGSAKAAWILAASGLVLMLGAPALRAAETACWDVDLDSRLDEKAERELFSGSEPILAKFEAMFQCDFGGHYDGKNAASFQLVLWRSKEKSGRVLVAPNDSIESIARAYGVSATALAALNDMDKTTQLQPGQAIRMPADATPAIKSKGVYFEIYPVSRAMALVKKRTEVANVRKEAADVYYIVRRGDSLGAIARRHRTTAVAIQRANGLKSTIIHPDQKLTIPTAQRTWKATRWRARKGLFSKRYWAMPRVAMEYRLKFPNRIRNRPWLTEPSPVPVEEPSALAQPANYFPRSIKFTIESIPTGADVYISSKKTEKTDAVVRLPMDMLNQIELRLKGYEPCQATSAVVSDDVIRCEMQPIKTPAEPAPE